MVVENGEKAYLSTTYSDGKIVMWIISILCHKKLALVFNAVTQKKLCGSCRTYLQHLVPVRHVVRYY